MTQGPERSAAPVAELDLLVLGSGVGGLSAAVRAAAEAPGMRIGVLTKAELHQSATRWAQGGVAAAVGGDEDSTDLHLADTLAAGAGLCDVDAVRVLVDEGPARVHELIALGADFDRDAEGGFLLAREGGHSTARILHAGGAATGWEIERALVDAVQATATVVLEGWLALELLVEEIPGAGRRCRGVVAIDDHGDRREVRARHVLLATGGAGQLFAVTTNPLQATGDALAMALRAGVAVADVEFMQFHPTALHHPAMPRPLLSEALRGHGAILREAAGERFVDELSPRDVVSRAMTACMLEAGVEHLWLDATGLERFDERFPTIAASLRSVGLDPQTDWLPIAPAAHYLSGGIITDLDGCTSLPGLWACGEAACTGVHGANRLGSNSLLEGMVFAPRVVEAVLAGKDTAEPTGAMRAVVIAGAADEGGPAAGSAVVGVPLDEPDGEWVIGGAVVRIDAVGAEQPAAGDDAAGDPGLVAAARDELQKAMTHGAGVLRSAASLEETGQTVEAVAAKLSCAGHDHLAWEARNLTVAARAVLAAAAARHESRGNHTRTDHPDTLPRFRHRLVLS